MAEEKPYREKNGQRSPDYVMKPGPTLQKATTGKFKKGTSRGGVSAGAVADALAKHWGQDGKKAKGGGGFDSKLADIYGC